MKIDDVVLARMDEILTPSDAMYAYVVAANGLFIQAEDSRIDARVLVTPARLNGLAQIAPYARLKVDRVPGVWLQSVLRSARRAMPNEAMYQFLWSGASGEEKPSVVHTWRCVMPGQTQSPTALRFDDDGQAVVDLHSHNSMAAFFSETDDADEGGLRFYAVVGKIDTATPEIRVRVGVYGHHMAVPAELVFDGLGPFVEQIGEDDEAIDPAAIEEFERQITEAL